jgi:methyl-accepting chemotaxis protein
MRTNPYCGCHSRRRHARPWKNTSKKERTRQGFRLPVIVPLVLYNGLKPWTAEMSFASRNVVSEVCADSELFGEYALNFKYYLIDVNRLPAADLLALDNIIAAVFFIDQNRGETTLAQFGRINQVLPRVAGWPEGDGRIFLKWLWDVALSRLTNSELLERVRADIDSLNEQTEVSMFVSHFAVNFEKAMKNLERQEADFARTKDELAEANARATKANARATKANARATKANARATKAEQQLAEARQEIERLKRAQGPVVK